MTNNRDKIVQHSSAISTSQATAWHPRAYRDAATIAVINPAQAAPIMPDLDLWDCWPLQHENGMTVERDGTQFWFFLSAPRFPDPGDRHLAARLRLLRRQGSQWTDCGNALADDFSPGHAEWAGSAVLHDDAHSVSLFFTAAGSKDGPGFQQNIVMAKGEFGPSGPGSWSSVTQLVEADNTRYVRVNSAIGEPGKIKAFRDPAWFRDPQTGLAHFLFTGSAAWSDDDFNGVIGIATMRHGDWNLERPLVSAIGVNNELERPHIVMRDGLYYLFWSTQRFTFSPAVEPGPNGLYAMVADSLDGAWRAVNGNCLVAGNPASEPVQSYSWWVTGEGEVWSFIDHWGMAGRNFETNPDLLRQQFGGTPAPCFILDFDGDRVTPNFT